jgi:DNA processing protein
MAISDLDIYRLFCANRIGPKKILKVLHAQPIVNIGIDAFLKLDLSQIQLLLPELSERDCRALKDIDIDRTLREFDSLREADVRIISLNSEDYPQALLEKLGHEAPPLLFIYGNTRLLSQQGLAIVGSRRASDEGINFVEKIIRGLSGYDVPIISGGAAGIDKAAHVSAIENKLNTIIVLSSGIKQFLTTGVADFPEQEALVISQFHPDSPWSSASAMVRNKLVCALSKAVVVVEAGIEGGTMHAGRTALEMQISLYVIDPREFKIPPPGNQKLIELGGQGISVKTGFGHI